MLWRDMKKALTDWLLHPIPSHLPVTYILQSQRSSERSSVPLQFPVVVKRETLRFVSASTVDSHEEHAPPTWPLYTESRAKPLKNTQFKTQARLPSQLNGLGFVSLVFRKMRRKRLARLNQQTRELISARKTSHKLLRQRPESPTVTLTRIASKYEVLKLHQLYILEIHT